jgi:T4 superinfection immunity protein
MQPQHDLVGRAILLAIAIGVYLLPMRRRHHQRLAIFMLNLLLGWSGLGWILLKNHRLVGCEDVIADRRVGQDNPKTPEGATGGQRVLPKPGSNCRRSTRVTWCPWRKNAPTVRARQAATAWVRVGH